MSEQINQISETLHNPDHNFLDTKLMSSKLLFQNQTLHLPSYITKKSSKFLTMKKLDPVNDLKKRMSETINYQKYFWNSFLSIDSLINWTLWQLSLQRTLMFRTQLQTKIINKAEISPVRLLDWKMNLQYEMFSETTALIVPPSSTVYLFIFLK